MCSCAARDQITSGQLTSAQVFERDVYTPYFDEILPSVYTFIGLSVVLALIIFFQAWCKSFTGANLSRRVRSYLMSSILRQEIGWFDQEENSVGALLSNLSINAVIVRGLVGDLFCLLTTNGSIAIGCVIVSFTAGGAIWKLSLVSLSLLPIIAGGSIMQTKVASG